MGGSLSYGAADPTPRGKAGSSRGHGPAGSWGQVARQTPGLPGTAGRTLWAGPWWRGARGTGRPASLPLRALGPEHVGHPLVSAARPAPVVPESDHALTAAGEASPGLRARQTLSVFPVPLQGSLPSVCLSVRFTVLNLLSVQFRALLCSLPAASQRFPRSGLVFSSDFPWLSVRMLPGNGVMLRAVSLRGCVWGGEHLGCCQHPAINTREIWRTVSGSQTT